MYKKTLLTLLLTSIINLSFAQVSPQYIIDSLNDERQKELLKIADPATGKIPYEELEKAREEIAKRSIHKQPNAAISPSLTWYERGPKDISGNIRCMAKDPNDPTGKKVWAGSANGGLWFNSDITNSTSVWTQVVGGDNWESINISSIAFNPINPQEMYVGTGDNNDYTSGVGSGIYKSTNGGVSFTRLSSTIPNSSIIGTQGYAFQFVIKLVVNSSGYIFANTWNGLLKSTDGGNTWSFLLNSQIGTDLEIGNDGILYAAFGYGSNVARIYRSTDATGSNWVDISPSNVGSRVEIALANSVGQASQVIYAMAANGGVIWFKKSSDGGNNWTDLPIPLAPYGSTTDFLAYYSSSMSMVVHPNNPNVVFAAGGYLIKSINGGANWSVSTTSLSGANGMSLVGDLSGLVVGGSRDVYYSVDAGVTNSTNLIFNSRNLGLRIQRATSVGMLNISDNGETFSSGYRISSTLHTIGSINYNFGYTDGTIFIDQDNPNVIISNSTLYNSNLSSVINLTNSSSSTAYDYDSQNNIFYAFNTTNSAANTTTFYKATGVGTSNTKTTFTVNTLMYPSFIRVGKTPNTIFVGAGVGKLYKISNIDTSPVVTQIDNNQLPNNSTSVSAIDIGANDNEILITYPSYGISSVWYTSNGGATWTNKDVNGYGLPNIPVRHARLIKLSPTSTSKVVLATELGVFTTNNIQDSNPAWEASNTGLPKVRCNWIYYRSADSVLAVATQGRGIFTTPMRGFLNPGINNNFDKPVLCKSGTSTVPFSILGTFPNGTVFNVELSNSSGSFTAPIVIGSGTSSPISVTLPSNLVSSNNYKLRIVTAGANPKISNESANVSIKSTSEIYFYYSSYNNVSPINGSYNFCEGSNIALIVSSSVNYSSLLSYSWSGPNGFTATGYNFNITNASVASAGTYTVTSVIESCQTYTSTVQLALTNIPLLNAFIGGSSTICPNTTTYFNSNPKMFTSGDVSYQWSGPNSFSSTAQNPVISNASINATGVYTVTAAFTGSCGGTATATTSLTVSNNLQISSYVSGQTCNGSTVSLITSINSNAGSSTFSYSWSGPNNFTSTLQNPTINNLSGLNVGVYTVTVTYTGNCVGTATSTLNLTMSSPAISLNGSNPYCVGSTVNLTPSMSFSDLTTQYSWVGPNNFTSTSNILTISNLSSTNTGTYTVTASYTGACVGTITRTINVNVNSIFVSFTGNTSYCSGSTANMTASLNVSGLTTQYSWTGPNGFTSTSNTLIIPNFSSANAGAYSVTVTYSGVCNGTASSIITLSNLNVVTSGSSSYCLGNTTNLTASLNTSGFTTQYAWSGPNSFTSTGSVLAITNFTSINAGVYTVTATYTGACSGTATSTVNVTVNNIIVFTNGSTQYCNGATTNITAILSHSSLAAQYSWTGPNGFSSTGNVLSVQSFSASSVGSYVVTATYSGSCNGTATTMVNLFLGTPFMYSNSGSKYCQGASGNLSISYNVTPISFSWSGPNSFTSTSSNPTISNIDASKVGTYSVTAIYGNGCNTTLTATTAITLATTLPSFYINQSKVGGEYCQNTGSINLSYNSVNNDLSFSTISGIWTGPNGFTGNSNNGSGISISSDNIANSGIYSITLTSPGCVGTATVTTMINISTQPKVTPIIYTNNTVSPYLEVTKSINVCDGNFFYFDAFANNTSSYIWTGSNGFVSSNKFNYFSPNLNINSAGIYTVTANITGACAGTATATVQVNFNQSTLSAPQVSITPQNYRVGEIVTLTTNCPSAVKWSFSSANTTNIVNFTPNSPQSIYANCIETPSCLSPSSKYIWFNNCQNSFTFNGSLSNLDSKFESSDTITGANKIIPVSNITYDAKNSVILNPGFEVQAGSVFKAQIDGCGNN